MSLHSRHKSLSTFVAAFPSSLIDSGSHIRRPKETDVRTADLRLLDLLCLAVVAQCVLRRQLEERIASLRILAAWECHQQIALCVPVTAHVVCIQGIVRIQLPLRNDDSVRIQRVSLEVMSEGVLIEEQMDHGVLVTEERQLPVAELESPLQKLDAPSTSSDEPIRRAHAPTFLCDQQIYTMIIARYPAQLTSVEVRSSLILISLLCLTGVTHSSSSVANLRTLLLRRRTSPDI
mmetsp:Transcript_34069/g.61391  ORF Transcript_34069/g.61391 Transcript_34069/m.61391 type:complete len:234 (+) Transcript_34069:56-757(+)